jgi:hypothetical protein
MFRSTARPRSARRTPTLTASPLPRLFRNARDERDYAISPRAARSPVATRKGGSERCLTPVAYRRDERKESRCFAC